ncbi:MAG: flagellin, partial [Planctomycetota bacterium]|nr:flagellin [Planctomycetota bacterium]
GQLASLAVDPALAMTIIEKAISDVSEQRATIGAVQANMLQTNENNLRVAIENITKTESNIRDTDMASEMTEFVKNQVLANAGLSMVTQANNQAQQVMALLQ